MDTESKRNRYFVYLTIRDFDCSPEELTEQLGIQPTEVLKKGKFRMVGKKNPRKMLNKINYWSLEVKLPEDVPIESQLETLLKVINPVKENFIKVSKKYRLRIKCVAYYYNFNPGIILSSGMLQKIAALHIEIGFDLYFLG